VAQTNTTEFCKGMRREELELT